MPFKHRRGRSEALGKLAKAYACAQAVGNGGGVALVRTQKALENLEDTSEGQTAGIHPEPLDR